MGVLVSYTGVYEVPRLGCKSPLDWGVRASYTGVYEALGLGCNNLGYWGAMKGGSRSVATATAQPWSAS